MRSKSDNIEIMMGRETNEVIEELFETLLQQYQKNLEESMRGSEFFFDSVNLLYYYLNKTSLNRGKLYIDSPKWQTVNPKNNDKCFQCNSTVALNHQNIKNYPERISKIKPFSDKYNWKEIEFPSYKKDWKTFELNNKSIALNIYYIPLNAKEIRHAYMPKYNLERESRVILFMITDGKKWHYLAVKSLPALLRGITSNHKGDFYCYSCSNSFRTKSKLKRRENLCQNHDYCYVEMPKEDNKILKYNHGEKSMKVPFIIYADLESFLEKS